MSYSPLQYVPFLIQMPNQICCVRLLTGCIELYCSPLNLHLCLSWCTWSPTFKNSYITGVNMAFMFFMYRMKSEYLVYKTWSTVIFIIFLCIYVYSLLYFNIKIFLLTDLFLLMHCFPQNKVWLYWILVFVMILIMDE